MPRQMQTFPQCVYILLQYKGIGRKIVTLVLNFVYRQNEGILVDSHVLNCAMTLQWIHPGCTTPESIRIKFTGVGSPCMWPRVNMALASFGHFSNTDMMRNILDVTTRDAAIFKQLHPVLLPLVCLYQPNILFWRNVRNVIL